MSRAPRAQKTAPLVEPAAAGMATIGRCRWRHKAILGNRRGLRHCLSALDRPGRAGTDWQRGLSLQRPDITRSNAACTASRVACGMSITRPHSREVSPGHLWVASMPILPPRPLTGEAKSR